MTRGSSTRCRCLASENVGRISSPRGSSPMISLTRTSALSGRETSNEWPLDDGHLIGDSVRLDQSLGNAAHRRGFDRVDVARACYRRRDRQHARAGADLEDDIASLHCPSDGGLEGRGPPFVVQHPDMNGS